MILVLAMFAGGLYLLALLPRRSGRLTSAAALLAILLHAWLLPSEVLRDGQMQISLSAAFSLVAWQSALLLWLFCRRYPLQALQAPIHVIAVCGLAAMLLWPVDHSQPGIGDWKTQLHVLLSILSSGLLTLAVVQAATLAVQDRLLHAHRNHPLQSHLPSLQTMETLLFGLLGVGFFMLSLTLVSGLLFIDDLLAQHLAHKTVLSICAWAVLGILLAGRWRFGWRGRTAIRWTFAGYAILMLAYFGSKLVLEVLLDRHWS